MVTRRYDIMRDPLAVTRDDPWDYLLRITDVCQHGEKWSRVTGITQEFKDDTGSIKAYVMACPPMPCSDHLATLRLVDEEWREQYGR